ncbi:PRD domain-containing protein [Enterococcus sp.]|uniref:PRD domain-containing protein n=1 Tax=Enterococcus sp. TaxID=35783 RepID=UPI0029137AE8|nr:PRD domain-containing protein [Enterococcus sp.]MDU5334915.1 PRD domain-containing protein [Enterococcus sp.]
MRVIKNINNNTSICLDSNNQEIIAFGKGIGFKKPPYEIEISEVQRTFYDVDPQFVQMINLIPESIFEIAIEIVNYAQGKLDSLTNSNIIFTLADHINFSVKRYKENMKIKMPVYYDVQHLYPVEFEIGKLAVERIKEKIGIELPKEEITGIALHIINAEGIKIENTDEQTEEIDDETIINEITDIIEEFFSIKIEKDSFNYSRFVSHLQYLLKRGKDGQSIMSDNRAMFDDLRVSFPNVYECAKLVDAYILQKRNYRFNEEEILYLILHINRLCAREDCYR